MRFAREMQQSDWDILDTYVSGQTVDSIADMLDKNPSTIWRKLRKITEKMQHSVLG